jgi:hypothetical protein
MNLTVFAFIDELTEEVNSEFLKCYVLSAAAKVDY